MIALVARMAWAYPGILVGPEGAVFEHHRSVLEVDTVENHAGFTGDVSGDIDDLGVIIALPTGFLREWWPPETDFPIDWNAEDVAPIEWIDGCDGVVGGDFASGCGFLVGDYADAPQAYSRPKELFAEPGVPTGLAVTTVLDAADVPAWLETQGYASSKEVRSYLAGGGLFLVVQVTRCRGWLPMITLELAEPMLQIPGPTPDDELLLRVSSSTAEGGAVIEGLQRIEMDSQCMRPDIAPLADWYPAALDAARGESTAWIVESGGSSNFFGTGTRIRVRGATGGLSVGFDHLPAPDFRLEFTRYDPGLEAWLPVCDEGFREEPGECRETACAVPASTPTSLWTLVVVLVGARGRRKQPVR